MDAHLVTANTQFNPIDEQNPIAKAWISSRGPTILSRTDFQGVTVYHFDLTEDS
jgi:hypothetical protein